MSRPAQWPEEAAREWDVIEVLSHEAALDACFIGAIRRAENGEESKAFGILTVHAPTFEDQCRACCNTICRYLSEYGRNPVQYIVVPRTLTPLYVGRRLLYTTPFIEYAASRYAPVRAGNDPHNLNANWIANVSQWYRRLVGI